MLKHILLMAILSLSLTNSAYTMISRKSTVGCNGEILRVPKEILGGIIVYFLLDPQQIGVIHVGDVSREQLSNRYLLIGRDLLSGRKLFNRLSELSTVNKHFGESIKYVYEKFLIGKNKKPSDLKSYELTKFESVSRIDLYQLRKSIDQENLADKNKKYINMMSTLNVYLISLNLENSTNLQRQFLRQFDHFLENEPIDDTTLLDCVPKSILSNSFILTKKLISKFKNRINSNFANNYFCTATCCGYPLIVDLLVEELGTKITSLSVQKSFDFLLRYQGNKECLRTMVSKLGNSINRLNILTFFMLSMSIGDREYFSILLDGLEGRIDNSLAGNLLSFAASTGVSDIVQIIATKLRDKITIESGNSALYIAGIRGYYDCVVIIIRELRNKISKLGAETAYLSAKRDNKIQCANKIYNEFNLGDIGFVLYENCVLF